ncbi:hypothetical protein A1QO_02650 [Vibrio genomosp. F10 str. ZF-129]|uniref:Uncharacterized protein n=1 Tax=Vibrio genomosp. F10 str. ZF-129 TaxID=1187848 RepID=A0A1E5BK99_9VIBR|nr:hypothetical protein [Vibrio genomosp. F10]OEE38297.1 hypothetical protein A1QO_02650 [Vibrio genomosp. F10 str. ZF-129]
MRTSKYDSCLAGLAKVSLSPIDEKMGPQELFTHVLNHCANDIQGHDETHWTVEFSDSSQLRVVCLEDSFLRGAHPTRSDLSVWDGTLK